MKKPKKNETDKKEQIEFEQVITNLKVEHDINYIDAIVLYCSKNSIEIENVYHLINKSLKMKIGSDAEELNLIEKNTENLYL